MATQSTPNILVLDASTRSLAKGWFRSWLKERLDCRVSVYRVVDGSRVKSLDGFDLLIISGSPASARQEDDWVLHELDLVVEADRRGVPILGVCFGAQLLGRAYWGMETIRRSTQLAVGWHPIEHQSDDLLFEGVPLRFTAFQYNYEEVAPRPGMQILAYNDSTRVQAFRVEDKPIWGVQFHLEITPGAGRDLLRKSERDYAKHGFTYEQLAAQARPNEATERLFLNFIRTV